MFSLKKKKLPKLNKLVVISFQHTFYGFSFWHKFLPNIFHKKHTLYGYQNPFYLVKKVTLTFSISYTALDRFFLTLPDVSNPIIRRSILVITFVFRQFVTQVIFDLFTNKQKNLPRLEISNTVSPSLSS